MHAQRPPLSQWKRAANWNFGMTRLGLVCGLCLWHGNPSPVEGADGSAEPATDFEIGVEYEDRIWYGETGDGFDASTRAYGISTGVNFGLSLCGSHRAHDLAITSLTHGWMLGRVQGADRWFRGNWELRVELSAGAQFSPDTDWFVGFTPHLRYNFATGTRWIPFVGGGAGVTGTGIGEPDLGGVFQFNEQVGIGTHWFVRDSVAITVEARYVHWSNAGIEKPNSGLNGITALFGMTFFY
jgi:hypothetical protein